MSSPSPLHKKKHEDLNIKISHNLKTESNFNKNSQQSNLQLNMMIDEMEKKDLMKQTDPDMDTLSRQDIMLESRDGGDLDMIEVIGEKENI